jgi:O-antigen/teichoic acid export membrane protein
MIEYPKTETESVDQKIPRPTSLRQLLRNSFFNVSAWGLNILVVLLTTPFIVRKLTEEGYGIFALLTGLVGYYSLLDLGLGQGVTKFVAEFKAKGDMDGINQSINAAILIQVVIGSVASVLLVLFADQILTLMRITPQYWSDAKISLYAAAIGFFFTMVGGTLGSAIEGLQRYDITSTVGAIINILLNISILIALYIGFGLRHSMYLTLLSGFVLFVIYFILLRKNLVTWRLSVIPDKTHLRTLFNFSSYMFISRTSSIFSNYIVRFVVGFFLGPISVTYYVISSRLVNTVGSLLYTAFITLFPFASEVGAQKDQEKIKNLFTNASRMMAAFAFPLFLCITIFAKPILSVWMGAEFAENSWIILSLLSLASLVSTLTVVPNLLTMGLGYSRIIGLFSILTLIVYTILLPIFTKWGGVNGTAIAMLLATIPGIFLVAYETKKIFRMRRLDYMVKTMSFHLFPIVISAAIGIMIQNIDFSSKLGQLLFPLIFIGCYFIFMVIFNWLPLRGLINQVRNSNPEQTLL